MRHVTFAVSVGRANSALVARLFYKKGRKNVMIGQLKAVAGPTTGALSLNVSAKGRKLLKGKKLVKLKLVVIVTPPGADSILKQVTFSLKRAKDPCLKKASASATAHAAC